MHVSCVPWVFRCSNARAWGWVLVCLAVQTKCLTICYIILLPRIRPELSNCDNMDCPVCGAVTIPIQPVPHCPPLRSRYGTDTAHRCEAGCGLQSIQIVARCHWQLRRAVQADAGTHHELLCEVADDFFDHFVEVGDFVMIQISIGERFNRPLK